MARADSYVHGFSQRETERLYDQAGSVRDLFHHDTRYPAGSSVLEAGCGVGAQTVTLARNSPDARIVAIDRAAQSLRIARALVRAQQLTNVQFQQADIFALPFAAEAFDHVFVCHVLEHLADPTRGLQLLRTVLRRGGTMTVIEGDHGSCYFHPESRPAQQAWNCLIEAQARLGGNSLIGRQLFPLLSRAGLRDIQVSPRMVYADTSKPDLMVAFVKNTIIPMVEGVRDRALDMQLIDEVTWNKGIEDLYNVAECGAGTFCYTFFKGVAVR